MFCFFFFFNDTATTEIYTLSLHDALPISGSTASTGMAVPPRIDRRSRGPAGRRAETFEREAARSGEHTSELPSQSKLVCRLLLVKKKKKTYARHTSTTYVIS